MEDKVIEEIKEYTEKDMKRAIMESSIITSLCFILISLIVLFVVLLFSF